MGLIAGRGGQALIVCRAKCGQDRPALGGIGPHGLGIPGIHIRDGRGQFELRRPESANPLGSVTGALRCAESFASALRSYSSVMALPGCVAARPAVACRRDPRFGCHGAQPAVPRSVPCRRSSRAQSGTFGIRRRRGWLSAGALAAPACWFSSRADAGLPPALHFSVGGAERGPGCGLGDAAPSGCAAGPLTGSRAPRRLALRRPSSTGSACCQGLNLRQADPVWLQ